ncbi:MAG TPA: hypothetical protein VGR57_05195 [Ktedonobacterales bacterium]|nr:hypothetical protein [Ktedonobacterales bacterium]
MDDLAQLAALLRERNAIDEQIASLIDYPPHAGHLGEYVASAIFNIALNQSKSQKRSDGNFRLGPLAGKSVNIKYQSKQAGLLDLIASTKLADHPDYYLVLTGPTSPAAASRGHSAPWIIASVFLFDSSLLLAALTQTGAKIGIASSVRSAVWHEAMIYPQTGGDAIRLGMALTDDQRTCLSQFSGILAES